MLQLRVTVMTTYMYNNIIYDMILSMICHRWPALMGLYPLWQPLSVPLKPRQHGALQILYCIVLYCIDMLLFCYTTNKFF